MKFHFKYTAGRKFRRGIISDFPRIPNVQLDTPLLMLTTKGGSIPHITHEVLQILTREHQSIQISLPSTVQCFDAVSEYKEGISKFVGLQEYMTYYSVQDPSVETPVGYNGKTNISIWSHSGRVALDANKYMDIMEAFKPDMYQVLCHGDTNISTSKKKCKKAVETTALLFQQCLDRHNKSDALKSSAIIGVVEGGYDIDARKLSAKYLSDKAVDGFAIDGLHNNGKTIDLVKLNDLRPIVEETLKNLPEDKLRIIHGSWKPNYVLELIEMGIDVFDSSLAYLVTERNCALIFNHEFVPIDEVNEITEADNPTLEISLNDERYKEDFSPVLDKCTCLTCRKHSRAYIYHLIQNKELLASVLLMIHNLHHYMEFFKSIRNMPDNKKMKIL